MFAYREQSSPCPIFCTVTSTASVAFLATYRSLRRILNLTLLAYGNVSDWLETGASEEINVCLKKSQQLFPIHVAQARSAWRSANAVVFPDRPDCRS
ncbi:hypothetical protein OK016_24965 [Vibrio chagasii]|nr:hypothetical protein [Vibrio chagasii]